MDTKELKIMANQVRQDIIDIAYKAQGPSHPGPALSCTDIITALYFKIMKVNSNNPKWEDRDRLVLSKGHACPVLYSALARKGFFPVEDLTTVRRINSKLQGHPDMKKTPGVDMTSGSLGNGLGAAMGMALYSKATGKNFKTYCILGDGEIQEGAVWEAALSAVRFKLDNLIAIVDYNHFQSCGSVEDILPMGPLGDKWKSFGWNVININGHDMSEIVNKLQVASNYAGSPTVIIANTVKGKGVSYMEHDNSWHQKIPTAEQYEQAMMELKQEMAELKEDQYVYSVR
ncbi:transketolase [Bacillus sp. 1NLA3E]|uniref:transketolase n=1 Tax=Bacillus sp. 1NLA3E TaxID=666686 RepID=UPI000247F414|nr:transketolase [Bacillus sp. 1NLA3E]